MDAHQIRMSRWGQIHQLNKIRMRITGYSRAAFRTGFYIPELNIMLDAGPQNFNHPKHIFITHTHIDHIAELPFTFLEAPAPFQELDKNTPTTSNTPTTANTLALVEAALPKLYGPPGSQEFVHNYLHSMFSVNSMFKNIPTSSFYRYLEVIPDKTNLELTIKNNQIHVQIIECDHSLPTVSYLFRIIKKKIKDEYKSLTGQEIVELKKKNIEITKEVKKPLFAFICDCSIKTIARYSPDLTDFPYVIVECTFLYEDDLENANKTKHIHWDQLKPYIKQHPTTTWILIHFSLRYKDADIRDFFQDKYSIYPNILPWVSDPIQTPTNTNLTPTNTNLTLTNTNLTPTNTNLTPTNTNLTQTNTNLTQTNTNLIPIKLV